MEAISLIEAFEQSSSHLLADAHAGGRASPHLESERKTQRKRQSWMSFCLRSLLSNGFRIQKIGPNARCLKRL
jgi:hypothetical protein